MLGADHFEGKTRTQPEKWNLIQRVNPYSANHDYSRFKSVLLCCIVTDVGKEINV